MTFKCIKTRYDYQLFSLLNFLGAAILNFMTLYGCRYYYSVEATVLRHEIKDDGAREI